MLPPPTGVAEPSLGLARQTFYGAVLPKLFEEQNPIHTTVFHNFLKNATYGCNAMIRGLLVMARFLWCDYNVRKLKFIPFARGGPRLRLHHDERNIYSVCRIQTLNPTAASAKSEGVGRANRVVTGKFYTDE